MHHGKQAAVKVCDPDTDSFIIYLELIGNKDLMLSTT
jgi:hypothetical protein